MKTLKYFIAFSILFGFTTAFAVDGDVQDGSRFDQELNERDIEALRSFLNTKREEPLEEKDENLSISGDVRFEYRHLRESLRGVSLRGHHRKNYRTNTPISCNDFDCEFNLKFDYIMERTWAVAHLQFDNSAGVDSEEYDCKEDKHGWFGSGRCNEICLRKAFMGYNIYDAPCMRLDIELGRRGNLYSVFDSRVQFLSRYDGVLLKWSGQSEGLVDWYVKLAGIVVDERITKFAYATEVGFLNICNSGFDFKYSFIDWGNHNNRCIKKNDPFCRYKFKSLQRADAFDFAVSQWTLAYNLDPEIFCKPVQFWGAFLINHRWPKFTVENPESDHFGHRYRTNLAGYAGVTIGEVAKEGDWVVEVQYQVVGATAVPGQDMSGIGTGNVYDFTLTRDEIDNTNFHGWRVEGLYALTDNITIDTILEASKVLNKNIGGRHNYSKVEVEAIYAF